MFAIESKNLTKKYGSKTVVDNINLKITKGSIFGFLGKNGAGKSTYINMITGLCIPSSGSFIINTDKSNNKINKNVQSLIGVMPDYSSFYDDLTAIEHMEYFNNIIGLKKGKEEIAKILKRVGLEGNINLKVKKYSFGMKKKLGIAQALINNPEVLFLDEPTSGVDADSVLIIHELIRDISKEGTTIFLTSHNLDEIEKLCDEIAIMDKGKIVLQGNLATLKSEFKKELEVHIKHGTITPNSIKDLESRISSIGSVIEWKGEHLSLILEAEKYIPVVVRLLVEKGLDIYRIQVNEPTLEEIFLNTGKP